MNRKQEPLPGSAQIAFSNIWQNATVSGRVTLVHGSVQGGGDGSIITWYHNDLFPSQRFPLVNGQFKALVRLEAGQNKILFQTDGLPSIKQQELVLTYTPVLENLPLHFCILVAKDSPHTFDSQDYKREMEGNDLPVAVQKVRMASQLMSAFTQEQMSRNRFGFRTFMPYEEFEKCTLSARDKEYERPTTHVHIVRVNKTVAEIQDPAVAQQNHDAERAGDLFGWAADALMEHGYPFNKDTTVQAACVFLDSHWNGNLITGHAALGGSSGHIRLAIFGGHAIHTWPKNFEDVVPYFMDVTPTDKAQVANDAPDNSFTYEALNVSMGAFMHEVGHLLGCPHEPSGVMLRGYENWNRSFLITEPANPRTNNNRAGQVLSVQDEDYWHRLDILRFRWHQSFRLPGEVRYPRPQRPMFYAVKDGVEINSTFGCFLVDIQIDGMSRGFFEFLDCPNVVRISLRDVLGKLSHEDQDKQIRLEAHAPWLENASVDDFKKFVRDHEHAKDACTVTMGREEGDYKYVEFPRERIVKVIVWSGLGLDGFEFIDASGASTVFGNKGGSPKEVPIDQGNEFVGLAVRSGWWVDAGGVVTAHYESPIWGGDGGSLSHLKPPQGRRIIAVSGWFTNWCQGIRIHYDM